MKKYVCMAVMIVLSLINMTNNVFAKENNDVQYNNIVQQQTEEKTKESEISKQDYIPVLMYHHFREEEVPAGDGANINIEEFEQHLKALTEAGYTTIFLNDLNHVMKQVDRKSVV